MVIEYTVTYPAVNHDNPTNDPYITAVGKQREFSHKVVAQQTDRDTLEAIFAGWNNGSQQEFPYFLSLRVRSMSVGDVVALYKPTLIGALWFICDSSGWLEVNATQIQSWLDFPRKYGCDSFELNQWKRATLVAAVGSVKL